MPPGCALQSRRFQRNFQCDAPREGVLGQPVCAVHLLVLLNAAQSLIKASRWPHFSAITPQPLSCHWDAGARERKRERERENHPFLLARPPVDVRGSRKHERSHSLSLSLRYAGRILRGLHADSKKLLLHRHPPIYSKKSHTVTFSRSRSSHMWSEGSRLSFVAVLQTNIKAWVEFKGW